jgi:hypothetical protein
MLRTSIVARDAILECSQSVHNAARYHHPRVPHFEEDSPVWCQGEDWLSDMQVSENDRQMQFKGNPVVELAA